jgi:heterodisulfide reductase subunit C
MLGKDKCGLLNDIRKRIAERNNIKFDPEKCSYEGECSGTCPKCESELEYLERELLKKQQNGEDVDFEEIFDMTGVKIQKLTEN